MTGASGTSPWCPPGPWAGRAGRPHAQVTIAANTVTLISNNGHWVLQWWASISCRSCVDNTLILCNSCVNLTVILCNSCVNLTVILCPSHADVMAIFFIFRFIFLFIFQHVNKYNDANKYNYLMAILCRSCGNLLKILCHSCVDHV